MLGFGSLGYGQLPSPDQRTRLDPGAIEPGAAQFGNVMFGGPAFPAAVTVTTTTTAVGDYPAARKRRYVVKQDGKLLVFSNRQEAEEALEALEPDEPEAIEAPKAKKRRAAKVARASEPEAKPAQIIVKARPAIEPLQAIDIEYLMAMARMRGQAQAAHDLLVAQRYRALVDLAIRLQDEEDVEMLLMAVH